MKYILTSLTLSVIIFGAIGLILLTIEACLWVNLAGSYLLGFGLIIFILIHAVDMIKNQIEE